jgi:hypothetical protein
LKKDGVRPVSEEIKVGAGGHRYVFVHPSSAGGVLLELVEDAVPIASRYAICNCFPSTEAQRRSIIFGFLCVSVTLW